MRLRNQRDDVKYLEKLAENRLSLRPIARRYLNLIRAFEYPDRLLFPELAESRPAKRVLKDAGLDK